MSTFPLAPRGWLGLWLLLGACTASAQDPTDAEADAAKKFQAYARESAAAYEMHAESAEGRKLIFRDEPVLRWTNPLGGRKAHGDVFLWTDEGRPAAVLSLYEYTTPDAVVHEHHEFCSLNTTPLVGVGPSSRNWSQKTRWISVTISSRVARSSAFLKTKKPS